MGSEGNGVFDHHSADYVRNWRSIYAEMRDTCPVTFSPLYGGYHTLTRYRDVAQAARDDRRFSSEWTADGTMQGVVIPANAVRSAMVEMDPPQSLTYRRALNPLFTMEDAEQMHDKIMAFASEAIDEVIESGRIDVVQDFTNRIPAITTLSYLGMDTADWRRYASFFHKKVSRHRDDAAYAEVLAEGDWVYASIRENVQQRRREPRADRLTAMVQTEVHGGPMSDDMAVESIAVIMIGGFDTTSSLLANSILHLGEHLDDRRRLQDNPELLRSACEEFLRYYTPFQALARTVTTECTVGEHSFQPRDRVLLSWAAANLDPAQFPDADEVRIDRFPNRHQSFGLGTHRCLGSHVARVEFVAAMRVFLERLADYRILTDQCVRYPTIGEVNGWESMPAEFTPGVRARR